MDTPRRPSGFFVRGSFVAAQVERLRQGNRRRDAAHDALLRGYPACGGAAFDPLFLAPEASPHAVKFEAG